MNNKRITKLAARIEVTDSEAHISEASESSSECYRSHDSESDSSSLGSAMTERISDDHGFLVPKRRKNSNFASFLYMERQRRVEMLFNKPADIKPRIEGVQNKRPRPLSQK